MASRRSPKNCTSCAAWETRYAALEADNTALRAQVAALQARVEELERASLRQAAPFRVPPEKRKAEPRRPGRKKGHPGAWRPRPAHVDAEVEVPLDGCPACGGALTDVTRVEQYVEELPEPVRPHVTRLITYRGRCAGCRRGVASRPPWQTSHATGAAGVSLGPRATALAAELHYALGLTVRKTCRALHAAFGLKVTPGGLTQAWTRLGERLEESYAALETQVRQSPAVYADETSWWVGGPGHWLWVFATPDTTVYRIEKSRGAAVVQAVLGDAFDGRLVSDCFKSYGPLACKKHKCFAHHYRALAAAQALAPDSAWLHELRLLLAAAVTLGEVRGDLADFVTRRDRLEAWATRLLAQPRAHPAEETVARRLATVRDHLFGFLYEPGCEPTNNLAERQLRPAVIARKVSCGNKTARGKHAAEILMSLAATARQRQKDLAPFLHELLNAAQPEPP
jgi:transposase